MKLTLGTWTWKPQNFEVKSLSLTRGASTTQNINIESFIVVRPPQILNWNLNDPNHLSPYFGISFKLVSLRIVPKLWNLHLSLQNSPKMKLAIIVE